MLEDFLPLVTKPARYINSEVNSIHKDLSAVKTKVCLFFPDTYEVGMSHIGLRILYDILNGREDTACERVFSPWNDYERKLRAAGKPLTSLESHLPLAEFDIIGITLQYELSYTNILAGLDLARIPMRSSDRTDRHPVIVAGGPCAVNPEPLSDFIDVFFVGEAEEAVLEMIEQRQKHAGRHDFIKALAKLDGFHVPAFGASPVRRRYLRSIESAAWPEKPMLPLLKPVHDRVAVEVARGCIRGCRFCQAGIIYRPFRERSPERVRNIVEQSLACTGYEEVSLASLSSGDYSAIEPLIRDLIHRYRGSRVSVSLPSLRVGTLTPGMIEAIAGTRKTGFTLAPEAGTERLRRVINKPVSDRDLMEAAKTIFAGGWSVLKLYFMIGLPTETDEDLDGIIRLGNELLTVGKRFSKRHVQINISVSTFVPKPHTPFQWIAQAPIEEIRRKQAYLGRGLRRRGISLKPHDAETSVLEGAFARGGRSLGKVIEEAVLLGCRFDGWTECFDYRTWVAAFEKHGTYPAAHASRAYGLDEPLPWDHIKTGVTKAHLQQEYHRAMAAEITDNCRVECAQCGIGCRDGGTPALGRPDQAGNGRETVPEARNVHAPDSRMTIRVRMKYTKTGRMRFLSHLDFMTLFHRTAMRTGVPVAFSQGFNPHPKIAFGPALPVGLESESEYLDMELEPSSDPSGSAGNLNRGLPEGVTVLESRFIPQSAPSLSGSIGRYEYTVTVPAPLAATARDRVSRFLLQQSVIVSRDGKSRDIRPCIESIVVQESTDDPMVLLVTVQDRDQGKARIQEVIELCFGIRPEQAVQFAIKRTAMYTRTRGSWTSPLEV